MRHNRRANTAHQYNPSSTSSRKANRRGRRRRRRNDAGMASSGMGMVALKTLGVVVGGTALALGLTLALSAATSLSAGAQDAILIGVGLVAGGAALAMKRPGLAAGLSTGLVTIGVVRGVVRMNVLGNAEALVARVTAATPAATTTAATTTAATTPAATTPAGWVTGTPGWTPALPSGARFDSMVNMTTPMVGYALG